MRLQAICSLTFFCSALFSLDRWGLEESFGSIYVINLDRAEQRLEKVTRDLQSIGVERFERVSACDGQTDVPEQIWRKMLRNWRKIDTSTPEGLAALEKQYRGEAGCYLSHYRLIKSVKECYDRAIAEGDEKKIKKYSSVLILEDDNGFGIVNPDKTAFSLAGCGALFKQVISELPPEWDLLYFVANETGKAKQVTAHLYKLERAVMMNAYAVNHTMYGPLLEQLKKIEDPAIQEVLPVDLELAELHTSHNCYVISPAIAFQYDGESYIGSKFRANLRQPRVPQ